MSSYRLQALQLIIGSKVILWINAYFPIDNGINTEELESVLTELEVMINSNGTNYVILAGDLAMT